MIRGLYTAASGMAVQMDRQNTISNNLANVNTVGFKKDETIIKQFPELEVYRKGDKKEITPTEVKDILEKIGKLGTGATLEDVFTEFTQGSLQSTNNEFDFAIEGKGFFALDTPYGIKMTRSGNFLLDQEGFLTSNDGYKVLGKASNGDIGYIKKKKADIEIGAKGDLKNIEIVGKLNGRKEFANISKLNTDNNKFLMIEIGDKENIKKEGANMYSFEYAKGIKFSESSSVKQGYLENSTVNNIKEMVEMISCSRLYETNQKALKTQDEMLAKAVNEIGKWG